MVQVKELLLPSATRERLCKSDLSLSSVGSECELRCSSSCGCCCCCCCCCTFSASSTVTHVNYRKNAAERSVRHIKRHVIKRITWQVRHEARVRSRGNRGRLRREVHAAELVPVSRTVSTAVGRAGGHVLAYGARCVRNGQVEGDGQVHIGSRSTARDGDLSTRIKRDLSYRDNTGSRGSHEGLSVSPLAHVRLRGRAREVTWGALLLGGACLRVSYSSAGAGG